MVEMRVYSPAQLDRDDWRQLQIMQRNALSRNFVDTGLRTQDEVDALISWDDPGRFYDSHINPNSEVGRRFKDNQAYSYPKAAVALENNDAIGFAYSAHNVSGETEQERQRKRFSIIKNYLWLRECVVKPDNQRQKIGTELVKALLCDHSTIPLQPASAYIWPDEVPFLQPLMERSGFVPTDERLIIPYGRGSAPVRQLRMQASTVKKVLGLL